MKKLISLTMIVTAFVCTSSALACSVRTSATDSARQLVDQQGGWPISDAKCEFLQKHKLYLDVKIDATVLKGTSIGWAVVRLSDTNNVISDVFGSSTYANSSEASMDLAGKLGINALRDAIGSLDFEKAAKDVAAYQKASKAQ